MKRIESVLRRFRLVIACLLFLTLISIPTSYFSAFNQAISTKWLLGVIWFLGWMLMSREYYVPLEKLAAIDGRVLGRFQRIKASLGARFKDYLSYGASIAALNNDNLSEEEYASLLKRMHAEEMKIHRIIHILACTVICITCAFIIYLSVRKLNSDPSSMQPVFWLILMGITPIPIYVVSWVVVSFLKLTITVLLKGPKGVLGTIGFILFISSILGGVYLTLKDVILAK